MRSTRVFEPTTNQCVLQHISASFAGCRCQVSNQNSKGTAIFRLEASSGIKLRDSASTRPTECSSLRKLSVSADARPQQLFLRPGMPGSALEVELTLETLAQWECRRVSFQRLGFSSMVKDAKVVQCFSPGGVPKHIHLITA